MLQNRRLAAREKRVSFRVSPEEYTRLEQQAEAAGATVSAFVRGALPTLLSEAGRIRKRPQRRGEALPRAVSLARIARNLEALRQWVTGQEGRLGNVDVVSILAHLVALERELDEAMTEQEQQP